MSEKEHRVAETITTSTTKGVRMGDGSVKMLKKEEKVEVKKEQAGDLGEKRMNRQLK